MKKNYIEYSCRITLKSSGESSNIRLFSNKDYDQAAFLKIVKNTFEKYRDKVIDQSCSEKNYINTLELSEYVVEEYSDFVRNLKSDYRNYGQLVVN